MQIVTVEQMRRLEAATFATGVSEAQLQERAGHAVAEEVARLAAPGQSVVILVGHGNNGRDGAVAAEWLARRGRRLVLALAPRHAVTSDELGRLRALGASTLPADAPLDMQQALSSAHVAVDALAGIGTHGALREPLAALASQLNRYASGHVLALDVPSGIDADSGAVPGEAVQADSTVTLGAIKQGLLRFPAARCVGRLIPREIGLVEPPELQSPHQVLDEHALEALVPERPADAHKYRFGRVLIVAGSDHFLGAPVLCTGGALRAGAGLVTVASTADVRHAVAAHLPEATFTEHDIDPQAGAAPLEPYLRTHRAVVLGPGLGRGPAITRFVGDLLDLRRQVAEPRQGLVIDADGLFALSELADWPNLLGSDAVLTPHAGELARLADDQVAGEDEPAWVQAGRLAQQWGCVLVAKGPFTCVAGPQGRVDVWNRANPALATGGTGDVLAGLCGGLLAQGCAAHDAARLAVGVHGLAAALVVEERGWRTLLASDLFMALPRSLAMLAGGASRSA